MSHIGHVPSADTFCKECAAKPGWSFDPAKAFKWSCRRCFQHRDCNDYGKPKKHDPAPAPKELVKENLNPSAQVNLPKATMPKQAPTPVTVVESLHEGQLVNIPEQVAIPPGGIPEGGIKPPPMEPEPVLELNTTAPDDRNEADRMLDAVQPNRPQIKLEVTKGKKR